MLSTTTKTILLTAFSIFFFFAVGLHIYEPIVGNTTTPIGWHLLYIITYGVCWAMLFLKNTNRQSIYGMAALFPFVAHVYLGYQHFPLLDGTFWVCVLVCLVMPVGFLFIKKLAAP